MAALLIFLFGYSVSQLFMFFLTFSLILATGLNFVYMAIMEDSQEHRLYLKSISEQSPEEEARAPKIEFVSATTALNLLLFLYSFAIRLKL